MTPAPSDQASALSASTLPVISPALLAFVARHRETNVDDLLLRTRSPEGIPLRFVAQQVLARRSLRRKLPGWSEHDALLYPPRLAQEQASSEHTAAYKADAVDLFLASRGEPRHGGAPLRFADLTAGMGIDAFAFAGVRATKGTAAVAPADPDQRFFDGGIACERDATLAALLHHNAAVLGLNLEVRHADGLGWVAGQADDALALAYLDPARRDDRGGRVAAFADCTPDVVASMPMLLRKAALVVVKASPMLDIDLACRQLGAVAEVHVIASDGECKELLFIACRDAPEVPTIVAAEGEDGAPWARFAFSRAEERRANAAIGAPGRYLFEPGPALMKAGAFRLVAERFGLRKLHTNTHLYTADALVPGFPGRSFEVEASATCTARGARTLFPERTAMLLARNAGMPTDALRARLGLRDGGVLHAIAATCAGDERLLFRARRLAGT